MARLARTSRRIAARACLALSLVVLGGGLAPSAQASDELDDLLDQGGDLGFFDDAADEAPPVFPRLEHSGYFRWRYDLFHHAWLGTVEPGVSGTGTSAVPAPLTRNAVNSADGAPAAVRDSEDETVGGANLRLRYQPTLHLSQTARAKATLDILDNLVLGSTPQEAGRFGFGSVHDPDLFFYSDGQKPPDDSVTLKELYGEWEPGFLLRIGRQMEHWGLGILRNGGEHIDADSGDYVDRVYLRAKIAGLYIGAAYDWIWSGATNDDPTRSFGMNYDLSASDVVQGVVEVFQRPVSARDKSRREALLLDEEKPAFDWGVRLAIRTQDKQETSVLGGSSTLVPRSAWALTSDLWLKLTVPVSAESSFVAELEAAAVNGHVAGNASGAVPLPEEDISEFAAALETTWEMTEFSFGLDAGFATGGDGNFGDTGFLFDRNYHVDLLLFREVIGTITNSIYVKPWIAWEPLKTETDRVGIRLDLIYGHAMEADVTPGGEAMLGAEADLKLYYHGTEDLYLDFELGLLLPGGAFDNVGFGLDADLAFTFQSRIAFRY